MATPKKEIKMKRGPKPGTGGRPARYPGKSTALYVRMPESAEEALARGLALHGSYTATVVEALLLAYPSPTITPP